MAAKQITALNGMVAPARTDPATFFTRADDVMTRLQPFATQANDLAVQVNSDAAAAAQSVTDAATQVGLAQNQVALAVAQAVAAKASADAAASTAGAAAFVAVKNYAQNECAISQLDFQTYRRKSAGSSAVDPMNDAANWAPAVAVRVARKVRTANTMLVASDCRAFIDITSGTFTQTFDTFANLGDGWYVIIRNKGTGLITIPSSDGVSNWVMYPGEVRLFQNDGTGLTTFVIQPFYWVATTSGNFIKPPGYSLFGGEMWGAGASGGVGDSSSASSAYGGGGGGYVPFRYAYADLAASEPFVIGAGGTSRPISQVLATGNAGGNTTFKALAALGGQTNGSGGTGLFFGEGTSSTQGLHSGASSATSGNGRATAYGGGAGAGVGTGGAIVAGSNSATKFGGVGGATIGAAGTAPGGGGAAGTVQSGLPSGVGARGEFRIWGEI
jgi:hypothetical protein